MHEVYGPSLYFYHFDMWCAPERSLAQFYWICVEFIEEAFNKFISINCSKHFNHFFFFSKYLMHMQRKKKIYWVRRNKIRNFCWFCVAAKTIRIRRTEFHFDRPAHKTPWFTHNITYLKEKSFENTAKWT